MVYSAKHREYQLVAKSTVPCFLTSVIFTMSIFSTVVCPRCAPGIGGITQIWERGTLKIQALRAGVCAPNFKTVSAPMPHIITVQRWKMVPITPTQ